MLSLRDVFRSLPKKPSVVALPPAADMPPLFQALPGGDSARAVELLRGGADAREMLQPSALTALHAATLGGAADAVPALAAAGAAVDAQLAAPVPLQDGSGVLGGKAMAPAGCQPLALACALGQAAAVQALLAAGASYELPLLQGGGWTNSFKGGGNSPWNWINAHIMFSSGGDQETVAARSMLLADVLRCHAAGALVPTPEQLQGLLAAAVLKLACLEEFEALAALPSAAALNEERRRHLARLMLFGYGDGDAAALEVPAVGAAVPAVARP